MNDEMKKSVDVVCVRMFGGGSVRWSLVMKRGVGPVNNCFLNNTVINWFYVKTYS